MSEKGERRSAIVALEEEEKMIEEARETFAGGGNEDQCGNYTVRLIVAIETRLAAKGTRLSTATSTNW